jgi:hypothetical protein
LPTELAKDSRTASVDQDVYLPGNKVTTTAQGFEAGERVQLALFSEIRLIGNFTADLQGQVEVVFAVADDALPGTHQIQFTGWCGTVIAQADVLVGSVSPPASQPGGWPAWLWWLLIVLALLVIAVVIRRVIQAKRAKRAAELARRSAEATTS